MTPVGSGTSFTARCPRLNLIASSSPPAKGSSAREPGCKVGHAAGAHLAPFVLPSLGPINWGSYLRFELPPRSRRRNGADPRSNSAGHGSLGPTTTNTAARESTDLQGRAAESVSTSTQMAPPGIVAAPPVEMGMKLRPITEAAASSKRALDDLKRESSRGAEGGAQSRYASEAKNTILVLGLSVHSTPVEMRERLAVPADVWESACIELCSQPHIAEAAVLSTCNRMEVYVVALSSSRGTAEVEQWMAERSGLNINALREHMFVLRDRDATKHVLTVAAGLDSLVLGEGQILSQVKALYEMGQTSQAVGRHLNGLFRAAVVSGKRVRSETNIAVGAVSVSSAAVELAAMKLPDTAKNFAGVRACVVGAGKMSRLVVKHLVSKGCRSICIVNRSAGRAEDLAAEFRAANDALDISISLLDELMEQCANSEVVFVASSSIEPLITKDHVGGMKPCGDHVGGQRRIFDISVPRNCSADINELRGAAQLFNVDDLKQVVEGNKNRRAEAALEAEDIILADQTSFEIWQNSLEAVPTIKALRSKAEAVRSQALEKALKAFGPDISKKERRAVEELSKQIINRILHGPMQSLRSDGTNAEQVNETLVNMHAIQRMFSLNGHEPGRKTRDRGA